MTRDDLLETYKEQGFVVVEDALSEEQLEDINGLVDRDMAENADEWTEANHGETVSGHLLFSHPHEIDGYIRNERTFSLFDEILDDVRFGQFDIRDVPADRTETSGMEFHRDISYYGDVGGKIFDPNSEYLSTFACMIVYLKDVHDCCPCFTIVPESHQYASNEAAKEALGEAYEEREIRGDAGTAIVYNITTRHTRKPGEEDCPHGRRTMHVYYSRESNPPLTDWATVPEELAMSDDPDTREFYSQWTPEQIRYANEAYDAVPGHYPPPSE